MNNPVDVLRFHFLPDPDPSWRKQSRTWDSRVAGEPAKNAADEGGHAIGVLAKLAELEAHVGGGVLQLREPPWQW